MVPAGVKGRGSSSPGTGTSAEPHGPQDPTLDEVAVHLPFHPGKDRALDEPCLAFFFPCWALSCPLVTLLGVWTAPQKLSCGAQGGGDGHANSSFPTGKIVPIITHDNTPTNAISEATTAFSSCGCHTRHFSKYFACIKSFPPSHHPVRSVLLRSPFYN